MDATDPQTIARARRGDRAAQAQLLRQLQDVWFRTCRSLLDGDEDRARDATQETALRFLRDLPRFDGRSTLMTWSIGIAINVIHELRRTHSTDVRHSPRLVAALRAARPTAPHPATAAELTERNDILHSTLANLTDRQREALVLRFFENLPVEETALAMKCAPGTVKATVHQALRILRTKLRQLA